jgi:hypothetical protein
MKDTTSTTCQAYYIEAWTDAGLGDQAIFYDLAEATAWLCDVTKDGGRGWILVHEHGEEDDGECTCFQYLTSHLPVVVDGEEV